MDGHVQEKWEKAGGAEEEVKLKSRPGSPGHPASGQAVVPDLLPSLGAGHQGP